MVHLAPPTPYTIFATRLSLYEKGKTYEAENVAKLYTEGYRERETIRSWQFTGRALNDDVSSCREVIPRASIHRERNLWVPSES